MKKTFWLVLLLILFMTFYGYSNNQFDMSMDNAEMIPGISSRSILEMLQKTEGTLNINNQNEA